MPCPFDFPPGFLWGAATSAHQVEGENRASDWWEYETRGRVPFASGRACAHYERYEQDFDLARAAGHNAHRFSIEWSRIEPEPGRFDPHAVAHYRDVVQALLRRGLEPVVTLHHFTNPAWFLRRGGWTSRESPALFERYVEHVVAGLGDRVRLWITLNEPTVYALHAYVLGQWPPCRERAWLAAARALRNLARAHRRAYRALGRASPDSRVGLAHGATYVLPCDPRRRRDRLAARARDAALNDLFLRWIGARPKAGRAGELDFLGINYYTCARVRSSGLGLGALFGRVCRDDHHADRGALGATGWEVHPSGLASVLARFAGLGVPLLVSENGVATDDEALRRRTLRAHLESLARAIAGGAPVFGYLYWSLIDNFEWALGNAVHFGLCAVDERTLERRPRATLEDLAAVARANRLPPRPAEGPLAADARGSGARS